MAKIWIEAYGCSASFADAEIISGIVSSNGHKITNKISNSDVNIIVTCAVKDATANRMIGRIKKLNTKPLIITGCLPKTEQKRITKFAKNASLLGPNSLNKTNDIIDNALKGIKKIELKDTDTDKTKFPKIRLNSSIGIIEISKGCMSECTFCQTKLAKGNLLSYRIGDIVRQITYEINDGCKEIWLTSTDNGCYGFDIKSNLPMLIDAVTEIPNEFFIRIGMMNPMYLPRIHNDLLRSYNNDKVFKFIHIPVQSGSNNVLKEMQRGHTCNTFIDMVNKFREKFPRSTIATDIIVGFPTETENDFLETIKLIKNTKPDIVNLSKYSNRPGTKSSKMKQMDMRDIKKRSKILHDLINNIALENNNKWIGNKEKVIFNEKKNDNICGRNLAYKAVYVKENVKIGSIHNILITGATYHSLIGKIEQ